MSSEENPKEPSESKKEKVKDALAGETLGDIKVWNPLNGQAAPIPGNLIEAVSKPKSHGTCIDLPDSYFEPTLGELRASYEAQVRAREALVNAPLKTKEVRERELKEKRERYPTVSVPVD